MGMTHTHFHDNHHEIVKNRAYSYYFKDNGEYIKAVENLTAYGSSSLYTTVEDLSKWMINLGTGKVGGKAVIEKMYTTGVLNNGEKVSYAYGLETKNYKGLKKVSHSGGWAGFVTYLAYFPEQKFGVTVLLNRNTSAGRLAHKIADIYLEPYFKEDPKQKAKTAAKKEPKKHKTIKVKKEQFDRYVGKYRLYTGTYHCEELDARYTIILKDKKLTVTHRRHRDAILEPEEKDRFTSSAGVFRNLRFKRDEQGDITGFEIGSYRAQDYYFKKI